MLSFNAQCPKPIRFKNSSNGSCEDNEGDVADASVSTERGSVPNVENPTL